MNNRYKAIRTIAAAAPRYSTTRSEAFQEMCNSFGTHVFNGSVMRQRLSETTFLKLHRSMEHGEQLDVSIAGEVAEAMKDWAIENGATHYAHVFYPLTGLTAEKHDAFLAPDREGGAIARFSAQQLVRGEADGSSLPSGGLRATFEARGYTAWDVTSPAYILECAGCRTLFIPTAFCAATGDALDKKTPLLRSMQAIDRHARRILVMLGEPDENVTVNVGCEQEYFLVDRRLFLMRPDLISAGRTLYGAQPPKGQELEDQYYGSIQERVLAFMIECEAELYRLGVPIMTRHNEVAPGQFEIAPHYEQANIASDHQHLVMSILQRTAVKHDFVCLLHEKPFKGVNGSGKHLNWSLNTATANFMRPGDTPCENLRFMVFCSAVIRAVALHGGLLRASVAHAGNDHRLGACEAPPAIISIFLGEQLTEFFEQIAAGNTGNPAVPGQALTLKVDTLPPLRTGGGDRNRTSPLAFTGGKFEFRAVGSSQSVAGPIMIFNTIVADSLEYIANELETLMAKHGSKKTEESVAQIVREIWQNHKHVVFNGDNYAPEWLSEAQKRGLRNLPHVPQALAEYSNTQTISLMERQGVLSARELRARHDIYLLRYIHDIAVEARLTLELGRTMILPAVIAAQSMIADTMIKLQTLKLPIDDTLAIELSELSVRLQQELTALASYEPCFEDTDNDREKQASFMLEEIIPCMERVREAADALEGLVDDKLWYLPTYQEMLFIR